MERKDFMWELEHPFPYGDADFVRDYKDLLSALGTGDEGRVVSIRKALKERLSWEDWEYMTWQEWKEGTARCRPTRGIQVCPPHFVSFDGFLARVGS